MNERCPQCHNESMVKGKIYNLIDFVNPPAYFRPSSVPFYAIFNTNIKMDNNFFACSFCGVLWSKIDNQQLQQFISSREAA